MRFFRLSYKACEHKQDITRYSCDECGQTVMMTRSGKIGVTWARPAEVADVLTVEEDGDYYIETYRWDKNVLMLDAGRYALIKIEEGE